MNKQILFTNQRDKHGDLITREALVKAVEDLSGENRMRWLVNHRRDLPPLGVISDVELIDDDTFSAVVGVHYRYDQPADFPGDPDLLLEKGPVMFPFISPDMTLPEELVVSIDKNNFKSFEEFEQTHNEIARILEADLEPKGHARKSEVPTPEIIYKLAHEALYAWFIWQCVKPFATKFFESAGESLGKSVADDGWALGKKALKAFGQKVVAVTKLVRSKTLPKNKRLVTIFELPGKPLVSLIAKTDNGGLIGKGLSETNLKRVGKEVAKFCQTLDVAEITFLLNENGHWSFSFLLTTEGATIGRRVHFKERDRLYNQILLLNRQRLGR